MSRPLRHRWNLTPKDAVALQKRIAGRVMRDDDFGDVACVAGVDVGFEEGGRVARAAVALLAFPSLQLLGWAVAREPTRFPYVPGLLSFREIPVVRAALKKLRRRPDLVLVDGQGLAHPRRLGIACHLGLVTGLPTIGVAKSLLVGEHRPPGRRRGAGAAPRPRAGRSAPCRDRPARPSCRRGPRPARRAPTAPARGDGRSTAPRRRRPRPRRLAPAIRGSGRDCRGSPRRRASAAPRGRGRTGRRHARPASSGSPRH